jgi:ribose transport system substrate-binding protein
VASLVAVGLLSAACGSSSNSTTSSTPAPSSTDTASSTASASSTAGAGVDAAKAYLAQYTANPTGIVLDTPLPKAAPKGKLIIKITTPEGVNKVIADETANAATALGWSFKTVTPGAEADGVQKAFDSALQQKPDGIIVSGYPKVLFSQGLADAKAANIPVVSESTTDAGGTGDGIIANLDGPPQVQEWGKMVAAAIVVDTNGAANVLGVNVPAYPILNEYQKGMKDGFTTFCPDCKVTDLDVQAADIGTKVPTAVVSALQKDPSINYLTFSFGDLSIGVPAAVAAAGLEVKIAGETATPANIQAVKDGKETAWIGFAAPVLAWRDVDAIARFYTGGDPVAAGSTFLPTQVLTKDNVGAAVLNKDGYYVGYADFQNAFKKLWLVG